MCQFSSCNPLICTYKISPGASYLMLGTIKWTIVYTRHADGLLHILETSTKDRGLAIDDEEFDLDARKEFLAVAGCIVEEYEQDVGDLIYIPAGCFVKVSCDVVALSSFCARR